MESKKYLGLVLLSSFILLSAFAILSSSLGTVDVTDYVGSIKGFAGEYDAKMRNSHSWIYGLSFSPIYSLFNSFIFIKLLNVLMIVFMGYWIYKKSNKGGLLLWFLSPVVWFMSPAITPIIIASLFIFLSYLFIKEEKKMLSGILLGLACLFWDSSLFLAFFFVLSFFFNKKMRDAIIFLIPFLIVYSSRFLVDYWLFDFPFYSLFRWIGGALIFALVKQPSAEFNFLFLDRILILIASVPIFLYLLPRLYKEDKESFFFIILSYLIFFVSGPQPRYLLSFAPILVLNSAKVIKNKEVIVNSILCVVLIIYFSWSYGLFDTNLLQEDINSIANDFPNEVFIAGNVETAIGLHNTLAEYYNGDQIKELIGIDEYLVSKGPENVFHEHSIRSNSKIDNNRNLVLKAIVERKLNRTFDDVCYHIDINNESEIGFKLLKSYNKLHLFKNKECNEK